MLNDYDFARFEHLECDGSRNWVTDNAYYIAMEDYYKFFGNIDGVGMGCRSSQLKKEERIRREYREEVIAQTIKSMKEAEEAAHPVEKFARDLVACVITVGDFLIAYSCSNEAHTEVHRLYTEMIREVSLILYRISEAVVEYEKSIGGKHG